MIKKREGAKINPQGGGCTVKWCSLGEDNFFPGHDIRTR